MNKPSRLRMQAMEALRAWQEAMQELAVPVSHPIASLPYGREKGKVAVRRARGPVVHAVETRPAGRSIVPIRELPAEAEMVNRMLKDVRDVDERYHRALTLWAESFNFDDIAKTMKCTKWKALNHFEGGLAILQIRILDARY